MERHFLIDFSAEEIIELDGTPKGMKTIFKPVHTKDYGPPDIVCKFCEEILGDSSDENIAHQCEYHSCPTGGK